MKKTGMTRKLDELGRIVIPKEIRNNFKIEEGDQVEFFLSGDEIVIKKPSNLNGLDNEIYKLFQIYNLKFGNSIAIVNNENIEIGYGKALLRIQQILPELNLSQYTSKTLTRIKNDIYSYIICNIVEEKYLIVTEEKLFSSTDSSVINLIIDYLIKLLKLE
jgi:AbrB family looped-hinge helix DNA binding protein